MTIELKAGFVPDQRLEKCFALDELKVRDIPTAEMQEIESVIDEVHAAFAIRRRLLVFLFAGLKIAFRGICARPDRSSIGRRVLLAPAELDSAIESR
jgi:hypothetical protein